MRIDWKGGSGLREVMKSGPVSGRVNQLAGDVAMRANGAASKGVYEVSPYDGVARSRASVRTGDVQAMVDNSRNNTLLRSLGK